MSNWVDVEAKFPVVANKKFLDGWIISFVGKTKKAPAPAAFVNAITELLDNVAKKLVLHLSIVLDACPLFMNRLPPLLTFCLQQKPIVADEHFTSEQIVDGEENGLAVTKKKILTEDKQYG